ncbi:molybdenum cofactor cytidylyltransferase [Paenibacillus barcinonensis]|nr:NTP transferase domain-containing protein [Paenibacillus barcinonensis]PYE49136.1 molybdenum cofactor cytidylyltransferase [Paenibacillus barcinonensis]
MQTTGIVLAAGNSSRLGRDKLLVTMPDGIALAGWTLRVALSSALDQIVCVVKPGDSLEWLPEECLRTIAGRCTAASRLRIAVCDDHAGGMANSIRCGLRTAMECSPEGVLMLMADQPLLTAQHINDILDALTSHPQCDYAAAVDEAAVKPPVAFRSCMFGPLLSLQGDEGARKILVNSRYRGVKIPLSRESFWDADTEPQLKRILDYAEGQMWREA